MNDLNKEFFETVEFVKTSDADFEPSNELKLEMYALYKQATQGDVSGRKPGMMDLVGKAKYGAWKKIKGMSAEQAMQEYIELVKQHS